MAVLARSLLVGGLLLGGCAAPKPPVVTEAEPAPARHAAQRHARRHATVAHRTPRDLVMEAQRALLAGPPGRARAVALYRQAAAHGDALAEYNLGYCSEAGLGVPADAKVASSWYRRAANGKDPTVRRIAAARLAALGRAAPGAPRALAQHEP